MPTLYLLLAHGISDFLLQPQKLVKWKHDTYKGLILHSFIHFVVGLMIFLPYMPNFKVVGALFGVSVAHIGIDMMKIYFEEHKDRTKNYLFLFLVDQFAHLVVILFVGFLLTGEFVHYRLADGFLGFIMQIYNHAALPIGLILIIMATYAYEIFIYQCQRDVHEKAKFNPNRSQMLKRLIITSIIFTLFLIFGIYTIAAHTPGVL